MASQSNFPAQVAPMSHVERVAVQEAEHSFLRQQAVQQLAVQNISKDAEQVQKMEAGVHGQKVMPKDEQQGSKREQHFLKERTKPESGEPAEGVPADGSVSGDVWSGNILNLKV
jgi:1,6-anhydro-N-acetylmuramate kinase